MSAYAIDHTGDHATDPGPEVADLDAELGMTAAEARSWLDVPPSVMTPDLARLTGHATDYEWIPWLADVLRAAGCSVVEYAGWQTRGRPRSAGPFTPRGVLWHHDGSPKGPSPSMARFIFEEGRPADEIPAPLAQLWVCAGCNGAHPVGTWHVGAAGRANHAGLGDGFAAIHKDMGNAVTLGVETDNTTDEPTPPELYDSLVVGTAALHEHMRSDPEVWLAGHKEYAIGRKSDPDDIDMAQGRRDVLAELHVNTYGGKLKAFPGREHFKIGHQCRHGYVLQLETWLLELSDNARDRKSKHHPTDTFSNWTVNRVAAFQVDQRALRVARAAHDWKPGIPNARTWRRLQLAVKGIGDPR